MVLLASAVLPGCDVDERLDGGHEPLDGAHEQLDGGDDAGDRTDGGASCDPSTRLDLNATAPAMIMLQGTLDVNGAPPRLRAGETRGCILLEFNGAEAYACSDSGWTYSVRTVGNAVRTTARDAGGTAFPKTEFEVDFTYLTTSQTYDLHVEAPDLVTLTGTVSINGGPPELTSGATQGCLELRFTNVVAADDSVSTSVCSDTGWAYSVDLFAGVYDVGTGNASNTIHPRVFANFARTRPTASGRQDWDVTVPPLITVSGTLTVNGAAPRLRSGVTEGCIDIGFHSYTGRLDSPTVRACASTGWMYSVELFAGQYWVSTLDAGGTEHPPAMYSPGTFTFATSENRDLDVVVPVPVTLSGTVTINGTPPLLAAGATRGCLELQFSHERTGSAQTVACSDTGWSYSVEHFAGTSTIWARDSENTELPAEWVRFETATFDASGTRDVDLLLPARLPLAGRLTVDGEPPCPSIANAQGCIDLAFHTHDTSQTYFEAEASACADTGWRYEVELYAVDYWIDSTQLRSQVASHVFPTESTTRDLDVTRVGVYRGTFTVNGRPPELRPGASEGCVTLWFWNRSLDTCDDPPCSVSVANACADTGWTYWVSVSPGEYTILGFGDASTFIGGQWTIEDTIHLE